MSQRELTVNERCEAAARAAIAAAGGQCLQQSVGDVAEQIEEFQDIRLDNAGTLRDGDVAFIDLSMPKEGSEEVFNILHQNGFVVVKAEVEAVPASGERVRLGAEVENRLFATAERPEGQLVIGME